MYQFFNGADVTSIKFWMEVPSPFFAITLVPFVIRIEIERAKNKVVKSQGPKGI